MDWLGGMFAKYPELPVFLAIGIGYWIGSFRIKGVGLGPVTGSLLAGCLVGYWFEVPVSGTAKSGLFLLFLIVLFVVRRWGSGILRHGLSAVLIAASLFVVLEGVLRFIPPPRTGSTDPFRFDLLAIGGSSMVGYPYFKPVTIPDMVQTMIHGRLEGRFVSLRNLADGGLSAHACWVRLERALVGREPDVEVGVVDAPEKAAADRGEHVILRQHRQCTLEEVSEQHRSDHPARGDPD